MYKVSVALATYNGEKYILKQLQSLLDQSHKIDEVVIVDDASNDKTVNIIKNFIKKNQLNHWILDVNTKNIGFIKNFKKAIEKTTGDVIFLCDQDDIWFKTKIEIMLKKFKLNSKIKALCSSFELIDKRDIIIKIHKSNNKSNNNIIKYKINFSEIVQINFSTICWYNISPGCTLAFTREIKDIFVSSTNSICVHDWEICFIAAILDGLYFFNQPLIYYRIHPNNTIGLSGINKIYDKKLLLYSDRFDKSKKINSYLKSLTVYEKLLDKNKLKIFCEALNFSFDRSVALYQKNIIKILKLYIICKQQHLKFVTLKGRIADILCIILNK